MKHRFHSQDEKNEVSRIFYFTNRSGNKVGSHLNLSKTIPPFQLNADFQMGDMVLFNGKTYEARKHITGSAVPTAANSGWVEIKTLGYVTSNDITRLRPSIFTYWFTAPDITADITIHDQNGSTVTFRNELLELVDKITITSSAESLSTSINISNIPSGLYTLKVANADNSYLEEQEFYYHSEFTKKRPFGVVEIDFNPSGEDFDLLTGTGVFKSPEYVIRFQNRFTKWRYLDKTDQSVVGVTGADDPLPYTEIGNFTIEFNSKILPNATTDVIKNSGTHWVSDIIIDKNLLSN